VHVPARRGAGNGRVGSGGARHVTRSGVAQGLVDLAE
jgi:hypothetical protein